MVERPSNFALLFDLNSNRIMLPLWYKAHNGLDPTIVDFEVLGVFCFLCHVPFDDVVFLSRVSIYLKNNNLHSPRIYNSYGSIIYEMITIRKLNSSKS